MGKNNGLREKIQKEGLIASQKSSFTVLAWATGVGKTKVAVELMKWLTLRGKNKFLILVSELLHKENWASEMKKWGFEGNIIIDCYNSMSKHTEDFYDLVVLDEMHHAGSDLRMDLLEQIYLKSKPKILGLSATIQSELIDSIFSFTNEKVVNTITLDYAISQGLVPKPNIHVIQLNLKDLDKIECFCEFKRGNYRNCEEKYVSLQQYWEYIKRKEKDFNLKVKCTPQEKYKNICSNYEYFKEKAMQDSSYKTRWLLYATERKRFLANMKTSLVKRFIKEHHLLDSRFLCFAGSIAQIKELGGNSAIHSNLTKKTQQKLFDDFNNKVINQLYAVGMLKEGMNLPDLDVGLIVQLDGNERDFVQKMGRLLRGKKPDIYIFYFQETRDEAYLSRALEGLDEELVTYDIYN